MADALGFSKLHSEEWRWGEGSAGPSEACSWTPMITQIFLCFLLPPSLTSVASLEHCVQCQDPWATSRAEGGDVMWHWNHKTKVPVWWNGGVYHTTQCVLHCCWLGECDTQLLWTLVQLVQLVDMAVLTVRLQIWETLKIRMPSHEVEETHKNFTRM